MEFVLSRDIAFVVGELFIAGLKCLFYSMYSLLLPLHFMAYIKCFKEHERCFFTIKTYPDLNLYDVLSQLEWLHFLIVGRESEVGSFALASI